MTNKERTPEDHFNALEWGLIMEKLADCPDESLCSLIQDDELPYVSCLIDYRGRRTDFGEHREDFYRLDNHVKSCYFCSEHYAHSPAMEFEKDINEDVRNATLTQEEIQQMKSSLYEKLKKRESEKPKNPEKNDE